MRKLAAVSPCRNTGSRLFGKPMQNLDNNKNFILGELVNSLKKTQDYKKYV